MTTKISTAPTVPTMPTGFTVVLERNTHGRLVLTLPNGKAHTGVLPVRAFPMAAPDEGISIVGTDGHELIWIDHLADVPEHSRNLIQEELTVREFAPTIQKICAVSSFSTPSTWDIETDRGAAQLVLKAEEDIRRLAGRTRLLITGSEGVQYRIPDTKQLDRASQRFLERFL